MNVSSKRLHLFTMELHLKRKRNLLKWLFMDVWLEHWIKKDLEDIKIKEAKQTLNKNNITRDSLPGYGNMGLKKKEIKPYAKEKLFIKVW